MIRLKCSNCGQKIKTDDKYAGKRVRCPSCKQPLQIPQAEGRTSPGKSTVIKFRCPNCSQKIGVSPDYAGKVVRCAKCKHRLRVPQPPGVAAQPKPQNDLAPLRVAPEQPAADEGGMPDLGDMSDLLQLEASAPAVEEPLQLSPIEEPAADSRAQDYESQFPTRPSYQSDGGGEKKKNKLVVPIVIGAVFIVAFVIGYMAVSSLMNNLTSSLETIDESQEGANLDEAQQFTMDYIALLAEGNIEAAIERLSPDVKATTAKDQIETLARQIGTSEILEMELGPTNYEQDLVAEHYYLRYTLDYEQDIAIFIASVRHVDDEFTIDGIATEGSLGPSVVIGPLTERELSRKVMMGQISEEELGAIGAAMARSFCGI
ncbi:MAG: zinc ribbon domain-containing protein, partial [Planctomycetota bacterium]